MRDQNQLFPHEEVLLFAPHREKGTMANRVYVGLGVGMALRDRR